MLDAVVAIVAGLLIVTGILVMLGPHTGSLIRRLRTARTPRKAAAPPAVGARPREGMPPGLNPKTQRVLVSATRLATWLRAHGQDDVSRELRAAAARLATDEPSGLYAMQTALRRMRSLELADRSAAERLRLLSADLRKSVQDRFEQLELLPFGGN
jgi:enoyl-CoA hydratase/carnithine racemase